jgi:hypothetical protein
VTAEGGLQQNHMQYRRKAGTMTWHFHHECSEWPQGRGFLAEDAEPTEGLICRECVAKSEIGEWSSDGGSSALGQGSD